MGGVQVLHVRCAEDNQEFQRNSKLLKTHRGKQQFHHPCHPTAVNNLALKLCFQAYHFHTLSISSPVTGDSGSQCWPTAMQSHSVYLFVIAAFPLRGQMESNQSS